MLAPDVRVSSLAETTALDAGLLEQLAVLLLGHALATLLDDRTHEVPFTIGSAAARPVALADHERPSLTASRVRSVTRGRGWARGGVQPVWKKLRWR
jgi:hypothetical protein